MNEKVIQLRITQLQRDASIQPRKSLNQHAVIEYASRFSSGSDFPPVSAVWDGHCFWLWDGFQRCQAAEKCKCQVIQCEVRNGTRRDAIFLAAASNADHGVQRTRDDRRNAIKHLLVDDQWVLWSDHQIAKHCCVTTSEVAEMRKELKVNIKVRTAVRADGTTYQMDTTNIGKEQLDEEDQKYFARKVSRRHSNRKLFERSFRRLNQALGHLSRLKRIDGDQLERVQEMMSVIRAVQKQIEEEIEVMQSAGSPSGARARLKEPDDAPPQEVDDNVFGDES